MDKYLNTIEELDKSLKINDNFDVKKREVKIDKKEAVLYFVDGLVSSRMNQELLENVLSKDFCLDDTSDYETELINKLPFLDVKLEPSHENIIKAVLSGNTALIIKGISSGIVLDTKDYPLRSISEPSKEKTLRGAKDGFTESVLKNVALLRRRIRDSNFVAKGFCIGEKSKADVVLCYIDEVADKKKIKRIGEALEKIRIEGLTACEQTVIEKLEGKRSIFSKLNPLPKARYTSRPDTVCAHLAEGKIAILVDNSPTALILPLELLDLFQDMDDYYFPAITGNYLRLVKFLNLLVIAFLSPLYLCFLENYMHIPSVISFFVPDGDYYVPIFWQFILLEMAIDALKLASLNTPDSWGNSLSVVGALLLGDMAIKCGWFVPQTIFVMVVLALANFTIPSIEFSYAMKFFRISMLIGVQLGGLMGWIAVFIVGMLILFLSKDIIGNPYMYPIIPFDKRALKKLIFRTLE